VRCICCLLACCSPLYVVGLGGSQASLQA
jgi:hypothetical protein